MVRRLKSRAPAVLPSESSEDEIVIPRKGRAKIISTTGRASRSQSRTSAHTSAPSPPRSRSSSSTASDGVIVASEEIVSDGDDEKENLSQSTAKTSRKRDRVEYDSSENELALEDPRSAIWKGRKESFAVVVPAKNRSQPLLSPQSVKAGLKASVRRDRRPVNKTAGTTANMGPKQTFIQSFFSPKSKAKPSTEEQEPVERSTHHRSSSDIADDINDLEVTDGDASSPAATETAPTSLPPALVTTRSGRKVTGKSRQSAVIAEESTDPATGSSESEFVGDNDTFDDDALEDAVGTASDEEDAEANSDDDNESVDAPIQKRAKSSAKTQHVDIGKKAVKLLEYKDNFAYRTGLDESLPPISENTAIFHDQVKVAMKMFGFGDAMDHLKGRKLRLGTMCSGTESPVLALQQYSEGLKQHFGKTLDFEHLFSAEIVPFKQAYIERNFNPPVIFRDIKELRSKGKATTAYGASAEIPTDLDLLVAGFSCVDFSRLNGNNKDLEEGGESGDTFYSILDYCKFARPKIVILENVNGAPWEMIKDYFPTIGYVAEWVRVDTKNYYIPHTRQRGYLIAIDNRAFKGAKKAVEEWKQTVVKMKRPASSGVEAFLLQSDDPRLIRAGEDMAKTGEEEKRRTEIDWAACRSRHGHYREALRLGTKHPLLNWENGGSCTPQDYMHQKWLKGQVERVWDYLEIANLRNLNRGFDQAFKNRNLECSQNVDRVTDDIAAGLTGCITPTGSPFSTMRGGPISGLEALALQGLPIDRLQLTRESQAKLQDLAGNAMSATVVGASILAALLVGYPALEPGDGDTSMYESSSILTMSGTENLRAHVLDPAGYEPASVESILERARLSSRKCYCEGRLQITEFPLQQCKLCKHTVCSRCNAAHQHVYEPLPALNRISPVMFEEEIKMALPMRIQLKGIDIKDLDTMKSKFNVANEDWRLLREAAENTLASELRYSSAVRSQQWTIYFESDFARMELAIESHRIEWRLFGKPPSNAPVNAPTRKLLRQPLARMQPSGSDLIAGTWEFCFPVRHSIDVLIEGIQGSEVPCFESMMGLSNFADKEIFSQLKISVDDNNADLLDTDISGIYRLRQNCGTAGGTLHVQEKSKRSATPLFLFLDPDSIAHPDDDCFVLSFDKRRLEFGEFRSTIAQIQKEWRPSRVAAVDAEGNKNKTVRGPRRHIIQADKVGPVKVKCVVDGTWIKTKAALTIPDHDIIGAYKYNPPSSMNLQASSCDLTTVLLACQAKAKIAEDSPWRVQDWMEVSPVDERKFFTAFAWLSERARKIPGYGEWHEVEKCDPFHCATCAPKAPAIKWKLAPPPAKTAQTAKGKGKGKKNEAQLANEVVKMLPFEDVQEAAPFERAMKNRPPPFVIQFKVDETDHIELRLGFNPTTLMHRALAKLSVLGTSSETALSWRLVTNYAVPARPNLPSFTLMSNDENQKAPQPQGFRVGMKLRPEQSRSLHWMISQESEKSAPFVEEEVEEALVAQIGWRAEGKATKPVVVRGGVLADQVGYGKTITTLALIDSKREMDRKQSTMPFIGAIPIKATLILVPPHLPRQWEREINKFLKPGYNVLVIKTAQALSKITIKDFQNADIIIASWKLPDTPSYLSKVVSFSGLLDPPEKSGVRAETVWYDQALKNIAEHTEMLKQDASGLFDYIEEKRAANEKVAQNIETFVPSKRLRGQQYQDMKARLEAEKKARENDDNGATTGSKRSRDESNKAAEKPAQKSGVDFFKLKAISKGSDWSKFINPLLEMFVYNRLVVDEYTYVTGKEGMAVPNLRSRFRWILSGTPPMQDFADVKSIAKFMGVNLGIDDTTPGVISKYNIAGILRGQTDSEEFRSFKTPASPAWHEHRHEHAQKFLNHFVRQNIAKVGDIPNTEHLRAITLPAAERAIYLELHQILAATDFRMTKSKKTDDSDRAQRIEELLGTSGSADEALLKRASYFKMDEQHGDIDNAPKACDVIVDTRTRQYDSLKSSFKSQVKKAWWLKKNCLDADEHFAKWVESVKNGGVGDRDATKEIADLVTKLEKAYDDEDWKLFYTTSKSKGNDGEERKRKDTRPDGRNAGGCLRRAALRKLATDLRKDTADLVTRKRALRLFEQVRKVQFAYTNARNGETPEDCVCVKCESSFPPQEVSVMTACGHIVCNTCVAARRYKDECLDDKCDAVNKQYQIVPAPELGEEDRASASGIHFGQKLEDLIGLIKAIDDDDQILLFVQFADLMDKVIDALRVKKVSHLAITNKASDASNILSTFQEETGKNKKKVLILNIGDASAAGSNLTNANHVIFLGPYLTDLQQTYDSAMTQAMGRARRYGQLKHVHAYHFASLKTIDVNILEDRTGKTVIKNDDVDMESEIIKPFEGYEECGFELLKLEEGGVEGEWRSSGTDKVIYDEEDD